MQKHLYNISILLVDDEVIVVEMLKAMLYALGCQVTSTTDSIKALQIFKDSPERFDLVITDVCMPKMDGEVLAIEVRKIKYNVPIIFCTGFSGKITQEMLNRIGMAHLILKPFTFKILSDTIQEAILKNNFNIFEGVYNLHNNARPNSNFL